MVLYSYLLDDDSDVDEKQRTAPTNVIVQVHVQHLEDQRLSMTGFETIKELDDIALVEVTVH